MQIDISGRLGGRPIAITKPRILLSTDKRRCPQIKKHTAQPRTKVTVSTLLSPHYNLSHALESVRGLFDEVVVVDTGSVDRTKEIALEFGATRGFSTDCGPRCWPNAQAIARLSRLRVKPAITGEVRCGM